MTQAVLTWRDLQRSAQAELGAREAWFVLERASGYDRAGLVPRMADPVPARVVAFVEGMVERRRGGEPLQYVLGVWGFRRLELVVDRRVLIPRPETEMVVEVALEELRRLAPVRPLAVDLGTGSGAIAISLALEMPRARVWGTDRSEEALAVARANLSGMGAAVATRVRLSAGDWFAALPPNLAGQVDLIVANPPYVAASEVLPAEVAAWEPAGALVAGPTGLEAVADILAGAPAWLRRPGVVVIEIAPHQAGVAVELASAAGFGEVDVRPDLAGRPRPRGEGGNGGAVIVPARGVPPPATVVLQAVRMLAQGLPIGIPTDTVYGLAVDPFRIGATDRIFAAKRRPRDVSLPLLVSGVEQALSVSTAVPALALELMARYWPGPLTIVIPAKAGMAADLGDDDVTVGVRAPDHPVPLALCAAVGPLATTSANRHGEPPLTTAADVDATFGDALPLVLDGGICAGSPSTVVDCTGEELKLLREGRIPWADLRGAGG